MFNDLSNPDFTIRVRPSGSVVAVFAQDKLRPASWLTLTGGVRQTHFSGSFSEDATSPRVSAAVQLPRVNWTVRGFYGRFYQAPPLVTASGPLLDFVTEQDLGFVPLKGERDEEYQVGVAIPVGGWVLDVDRFQTTADQLLRSQQRRQLERVLPADDRRRARFAASRRPSARRARGRTGRSTSPIRTSTRKGAAPSAAA